MVVVSQATPAEIKVRQFNQFDLADASQTLKLNARIKLLERRIVAAETRAREAETRAKRAEAKAREAERSAIAASRRPNSGYDATRRAAYERLNRELLR